MKSLADLTESIQQLNIVRYLLPDDGTFPNNNLLPLMVFKKSLLSADEKVVKEIFESNGWTNAWTNGIYDYHHYHSITHEALGIINGAALVQFGGENGIAVPLEVGDVVIIPAGVAHKKLSADEDFRCVGAYPDDRDYDIKKGNKGERPEADENIRKVPMPETDPVYGAQGPLIKNWSANVSQASVL